METESTEQTTSNNVSFPDEYSLEVYTTKTDVLYVLKDSNNYEAAKFKTVEPLMIGEQSNLGKEIRKHLNPQGRLSKDAVNEDFEKVKQVLNELYQLHQISKDKEEETKRLENERELQANLDAAKQILENKDQPLIYIASLVSWLTAGERANIILTFIAYASQVILRNPINVVVLGEGGSGKALALDTKIPTPDGFKTINEIDVGDDVFDEKGNICKVTHKSPVFYNHECFELTFNDHCKIVADAEHRWKTFSHYQRDKLLDGSILTTEQLFKTHKLKKGKRIVNNYAIETCEPLQLPEKQFPIDPYILGLWLGDGHSHDAHFTTIDMELLNAFIQHGFELHPKKHDKNTWNVLGLHKKLRLSGLLHNKHIPKEYLRGSFKQRLSLIQGLMDTDGHIDKNGNCEITQKNKILINGLCDLLKSIGIKARVKSTYKQATNTNSDYGKYYILHFTTNLPIFRLGRKLERIKAKQRKTQGRRYISSIKPVKSVPTQCIAVNSKSHLFLCSEDYIPTHNTHIETTALSLIPDEYVIKEKKTTQAAFYDKGVENPRVYDGKIVSFGDLGGESSQDFVMEIKDLLKELQTDGYLSKTMIGNDSNGDRQRVHIELFGHPCTTYTTVPGHTFDDQEMSRSIFITPRMDNKDVFHAMKKMLELHGGRTHKQYQKYLNEVEIVKYIVYLLRERMQTVIINNPYTESIIKFLGESEYFKRDLDKYNGILKTITAINGYNRATFNIDGQDILYTNLSDIQIFISLLEVYHESISVNISPKAAELLDEIRGNIDEWIVDPKVKQISDMGVFTVNDFMELTDSHLQKRSLQNYFGELNRAGFLKVVGKKANSNEYQLSGRVSSELLDNLLVLSDEQKELIEWELGSIAKDFICEDEIFEGLNIHLQDFDVDVPGWDRYDKAKVAKLAKVTQ
ncbi:MAG: ribonucleotide-diphosphate reductase subunit alpha [Methanobacterium sp. PtaU1.Bin242]|nr:MAG: ribonucleotide-diphosphate reductase subunit alpha [Methanobacterium sp. PtaU1.Bin242]